MLPHLHIQWSYYSLPLQPQLLWRCLTVEGMISYKTNNKLLNNIMCNTTLHNIIKFFVPSSFIQQLSIFYSSVRNRIIREWRSQRWNARRRQKCCKHYIQLMPHFIENSTATPSAQAKKWIHFSFLSWCIAQCLMCKNKIMILIQDLTWNFFSG